MSEKRFVQLGDTTIKDTLTGEEWYAPCEYSLLDLLNEQDNRIEQLDAEATAKSDEIYVLNERIKELEKENEYLKVLHMGSMFNTVKSFKGDVSKRYVYNEETDTIYDTANQSGSYYKILDKKEITLLLNEYNTLLEKGEK